MSHLDELDEFEAELELTLKKEYSAVFSLFRYCVLTQDATYLCNRLDLQYVPQPSYPFFHLKMEDVWVWDKNRPTRIIPRAEVYTSSDVTVEELRGEGDEPNLTAEALAERIGESLSSDDEVWTAYGLTRADSAPSALRCTLGIPSGSSASRQRRVGSASWRSWRSTLGTRRRCSGCSTARAAGALAHRDRASRSGDELGALLRQLPRFRRASTGSARLDRAAAPPRL